MQEGRSRSPHRWAREIAKWGKRAEPGPYGSANFSIEGNVKMSLEAEDILRTAVDITGDFSVGSHYAKLSFILPAEQ